MNIGDMILKLRKEKGLSQEEMAEKLKVTRQTVSKWETGESKPDFDKIIPLCDLFSITTEELLRGKKKDQKQEKETVTKDIKKERAKVLSVSIFLYFLSVIWVVFMESLTILDSDFVVCGFLLICAIATSIIIYHFVSTKNDSEKEKQKEDKKSEVDGIIALIFTLIYLYISFTTMMWHITWLIWIIYAIVIKIVHLFILLGRGDFDE